MKPETEGFRALFILVLNLPAGRVPCSSGVRQQGLPISHHLTNNRFAPGQLFINKRGSGSPAGRRNEGPVASWSPLRQRRSSRARYQIAWRP